MNWYWALGIVAVCVALISVLFGNLLFGIIILVAAFTLALLAQTPPPLVEFHITERGIRINERMHRFEDCIAFWVEDHDADPPLLLVDTTQWMSPNLVIPLVDIDPYEVRAFLSRKIEERPMKEPVAHKILEAFGL